MPLRLTAPGNGRAVDERRPLWSSPSVVRTALLILSLALGVAAALWMLYRLAGVILLLILAVFFAYLVSPLVEKVRRPITVRGKKCVLPKPAAIGLIYVLVFGSIAAACVLLLPALDDQLGELSREAPSHVTRVQTFWQSWQTGYQNHAIPQEVRDAIDRARVRRSRREERT
jgi:predicted PurR-regulated permease PerM